VKVPAHGLCPVPDLDDAAVNPQRLDLAALSVVADAVSTPYQAIHRSGLRAGDLAIFIGVGGVGGFGVQVAAAMGAHVIAIDMTARLATMSAASLALRADRIQVARRVRDFAGEHRIPTGARRFSRRRARRPDRRPRSDFSATAAISASSASPPRRPTSASPT
jgi:6-hydroxycyclohex-1-ene-1-carbonyl-CoA dehydrogenase